MSAIQMALFAVGVNEISFVGSSSASATESSMSTPSGVQAGDIVIYINADDTGAPPIAIPTGYTEISQVSGDIDGCIAYKIMGATPDATISGLETSDERGIHVAVAYRGVNTSTPLDNTPTGAVGDIGMPDPPSITTVTNNAMVVAIGGLDDDLVTPTAPSGYSDLVYYNYGSDGDGGTVMIASKIVPVAGAEDPGAFGGAGTDDWLAGTIALRPA